MKTTLKFLILWIVASSLFLSGCKKDDEEDETPVATNVFSAKINGSTFSPSNPGGMKDIESNELWITGDNSAGMLSLTIPGDIAPGTYNLSVGSGSGCSLDWEPESAGSHFANPGTLIITKHDVAARRIEGTFSATLQSTLPPTLPLTDGVVKITYMAI